MARTLCRYIDSTLSRDLLLRRIRFWLALFIAGVVVSGVTAFPLEAELSMLTKFAKSSDFLRDSGLVVWLSTVQRGLVETNKNYPFLAYGTDWLAFAHLVIAIAFIGAWRDPVRNKWLFTFGLIACAGVIPLALLAGDIRGIPFGWRLLDCSFGLVGAIPLWICRYNVGRLEQVLPAARASHSTPKPT
jgi:hypothetical protein